VPDAPPPPAAPTTLKTATRSQTATTSITIQAVYTSPMIVADNTTVYSGRGFKSITNFGQTLSGCLTEVDRDATLGWAYWLPGPMACFGTEELFFDAVPGSEPDTFADSGQAFRKKSYRTWTTATRTTQTTQTSSTTSRTTTRTTTSVTTTTTCRPLSNTCNSDAECCFHSSGGTTSQTGGSVCYDSGSGVKTCSGPKCSSVDFTQCGLCLDSCGRDNQAAVCSSFNVTMGDPKCIRASATNGGGLKHCRRPSIQFADCCFRSQGGRCPGSSVCCFAVPSVPSDIYGNCPSSL
jgi:hypothetical protein